jgi:hypothetical protein
MPNYPTHKKYGYIGAVVTFVGTVGALYQLFGTPVVAVLAAMGTAGTTFAGAIYPDIDHHNSIPRRKAVKGLQLILGIAIPAASIVCWGTITAGVEAGVEIGTDMAKVGLPVSTDVITGGIVALTIPVAASSVDPVFGIATRQHRGWTHSVPVNAALIGIALVGVWIATPDFQIVERATVMVAVGGFFIGTLIHLGLDGEIL